MRPKRFAFDRRLICGRSDLVYRWVVFLLMSSRA